MELVLSVLGGIGILMAIAVNATTVTRFVEERRRSRRDAAATAPPLQAPECATREPADATEHAGVATSRAAGDGVVAGDPRDTSRRSRVARPTIRTPDQRVRVFVSSTLAELADERAAVRSAIEGLRLTPVMFESGARAHPPRELYRAYLEQSDVFVGIYARRYGWVAPGEQVSGLEDEYLRSGERPKLIYVKRVEDGREPALETLLGRVRSDDRVSYRPFRDGAELRELVADDLAMLLSERFERPAEPWVEAALAPVPGVWGPLFGRERELSQALDMLDDPGVRLVTLVGPGGIGKSRLALELAHLLRVRSGDDVAFVGLQGVVDDALVPEAIATGLGLRATDERSAAATLEAYLGSRRTLLVLDNLEQVTGAAPFLSRLLEVASGLTLLVTSRVPLRLSAERCVPVGPLSLTPTGAEADPASCAEAARNDPAVALFVWRARAHEPGFAVEPENAATLLRLVRRLEGWPLAILLAAARVRHMSLEHLARRLDATLDARLDTLADGARDMPERQRTMRRTIAWSVDLLSDEARTLLRRASVFVGGADLGALEAVLDDGAAGQVELGASTLGAVAELVDHGLLRRLGGADGTRYASFDLVREVALERLRVSGEEDAVRARHAEHFAALAVADGGALQQGRVDRLAVLRTEAGNLRGALAFVRARRDVPAAARFARALWLYWWIEGQGGEHAPWIRELLEHGARSPEAPSSRERLDLLLGLCACTLQRRDLAAARAALDDADAALAAVDDPPARTVLHIGRAILDASEGDLDGCREHAEAARAGGAACAWPWAESFGWVLLARAAIGRRDLAEALRCASAAADLQAAAGDRQSESWARLCLAVTHGLAGRSTDGWAQLRVALANLDALAYHGAAVFALEVGAFLAHDAGAHEHAARLAGAAASAERRFGSAGFEPETSVVRAALADVAADVGAHAAAWREGATMPLDVAVRYALGTQP